MIDFTETLIWYYKGERNEALWLLFFGILILLLSAVIWKNMHSNDLLRGIFYPVVLLGLVASLAGGFNAYNNSQRLIHLPEKFIEDSKGFVALELERFDGKGGVNSWWLPLKVFWSLLLLAGILLAYNSPNYWWQGFALGLLMWGTFGWGVDGFAHQRAEKYTVELKSYE
jgi:hypothetical protein